MVKNMSAGAMELELLGRIRAHMGERNITQRSVAQKLGLNEGHFSQLLTGVRPMRIGHLLKIIKVIGFRPSLDPAEDEIVQARNSETMQKIMGLLYRIDQYDGGSLQRIYDYLEGFYSAMDINFKKKIV